jgi:hypothetical protein
MAWHRIDYDALWASDKIALCSDDAQADYAWIYGIADVWGCFELSNLRVIHGRVAPIRTGLSFERLERSFKEYHLNGLCFIWQAAGKKYGFWTGSEKRLPSESTRQRYPRSTPAPPTDELEQYLRPFGKASPRPVAELSRDSVATESRLTRDNSNGTEKVTEREPKHTLHTAPSRPPAEECGPDPQPDQFQVENDRGENGQGKPYPRMLLEIYEQERGPLPSVKDETDKRLTKCRRSLLSHSRDQEKFLANFRASVRKASQLTWPGWRPSFDWFVDNDTNYMKVLEGNYDDWGKSTARNMSSKNSEVDREVRVGSGPTTNVRVGQKYLKFQEQKRQGIIPQKMGYDEWETAQPSELPSAESESKPSPEVKPGPALVRREPELLKTGRS